MRSTASAATAVPDSDKFMASPVAIVLNHAAVAYQNADGASFSEAAILGPDEAGFYDLQNDLLDVRLSLLL
jgi:hypothetical protein